MTILSQSFEVQTQGNTQVIDLTARVADCLKNAKLTHGIVAVFVVGSTAALTTTEYEPGLVNRDLKAAFEKIAPEDAPYLHEQTWHDDNGHSHVRASLLGPSLTVPFNERKLELGTWQQIVLIDFDTRPRSRKIIVQLLGE